MLTQLLAPLHSEEKRKVIEAIHSLGLKVVPEDIALKEGMPLNVVTLKLNEIATETGGNFRVSDAGTIQYIFEPHFETQYIVNAARNTWQSVFRIIANVAISGAKLIHLVLMSLFRISIGLILIGSVIVIIALIILAVIRLLSAAGDSDGGDIDIGDVGGDMGGIGLDGFMSGFFTFTRYFLFDWLFDWWFWRHSYFSPWRGYGWGWGWGYDPWHYDPGGSRHYYDDNYWVDPFFSKEKEEADPKEKEKQEKGPDFLSICYEFVFGPENPNKDLVGKYWKSIAAIIRNNGGVVTAEQLAPYTGKEDSSEDWMLPILTRFEGSPEVTDSGNIVYVFPKFVAKFQGMQYDTPVEAANDPQAEPEVINADALRAIYTKAVKRQPTVQKAKQKIVVPNYLEEELQSFVDFDMAKLTPAVLLGLVELGGSIYLFTLMSKYSFLSDFKPLIIFLLAYGVLFFTIPAVRAFLLAAKNTATQERNEQRLELFARVNSPSAQLKEKLEEAKQVRSAVASSRPTKETEVYTTEKDWLEQQQF